MEMRRLRTWISNEGKHMTSIIASLSSTDPLLSREVERRWKLRNAVNTVHIQRLDRIQGQTGFVGSRGEGVPAEAARETAEDVDAEADNDIDEHVAILTDFVSGI